MGDTADAVMDDPIGAPLIMTGDTEDWIFLGLPTCCNDALLWTLWDDWTNWGFCKLWASWLIWLFWLCFNWIFYAEKEFCKFWGDWTPEPDDRILYFFTTSDCWFCWMPGLCCELDRLPDCCDGGDWGDLGWICWLAWNCWLLDCPYCPDWICLTCPCWVDCCACWYCCCCCCWYCCENCPCWIWCICCRAGCCCSIGIGIDCNSCWLLDRLPLFDCPCWLDPLDLLLICLWICCDYEDCCPWGGDC